MKPNHLACRAATVAALAAGLSACGDGTDGAWRDAAPAEAAVDAGYIAPPNARSAAAGPGGVIAIRGTGTPGSTIRLVTPAGEALSTTVDARGGWSLAPTATAEPRLYGLSMSAGGRVQQASGYLLTTPGGLAAQLRAGAGAMILGTPGAAPRILVVDYDRDGGAVVSGLTRPGGALAVRVDRRPAGDGKADGEGRFAMAVSQPLRAGAHRIDVSGEGGGDVVDVMIGPTRTPPSGAFVAARTSDGWRIDWITPGGGPQTTLVLDRGEIARTGVAR